MKTQSVMKAIAQTATKAAKAMVKTMIDAVEGNDGKGIAGSANPKSDEALFKEPTFSWAAKDKFTEHNSLKMEVNNIFMTAPQKNYNTDDSEQVPIIKN